MKRSLAILALGAFTAAASLTGPLAGQLAPLEPVNPPSSSTAPDANTPTEDRVAAYFVELFNAPTADGGSLTDLNTEKQNFRNAARKAGIQYKERFRFDKVWNGFSVAVAPGDVAKLARMAEVKAIYPVAEVQAPTPEVGPESEMNLSTALAMTQADIAQNDLGLTGRGIRVAILDTGVDYDHPDLGGCFGPGCKVAKGYDFVGDAYNADPSSPTYNLTTAPDAFPDDCAGHGTHVSGIVGANGRVRGVAPEATLSMYRVFGCEGSTQADIMVAAMEKILDDGADVLNISIGASFQWPDYPTAKAADRLVRKGIVVVSSAGNSGTSGLYASGAPALGDKVISVASYNNTHLKVPSFFASPDNRQVPYQQATGAATAPTSGSAPLARTGTPTSTADACTALPAGSLTGKIALIRRGTCGFHDKARNAQAAGAVGAIIFNNTTGLQNITVAGPVAINIPVVSIPADDGVVLSNRLATGTADLTWSDAVFPYPNATGNLIASSSSFGMSPDLNIKPDIGAPGALIYSTWPLEHGGYANLSGTSMSSPHVAGAVALLLQARPHTPPALVRTLLQNTAEPKPWAGNPALGFLDNVHRQGAGMLRIADAIGATVKAEPSKLALGESEAGPAVRTVTVTNEGKAAVTYTLSQTPALATGPNTFTPTFLAGFANVAFSVPTLTIAAGGTATFDVTVTPNPALQDGSLYGGYLLLTPQADAPTLRIPYAGFKGDYQGIQVLKPTASNFPWLAKYDGATFFNQTAGATYTMAGLDIPRILVHFDHQLRSYKVEVFDADTGKAWHRAFSQEWVGRNTTASGFFTLSWDGTTTNGKQAQTVPNGRYILKLSVVKALGDESNPAHVETWTSPVVTLARP
jgi:minor extracellular serine protease Vpr